MVKKTDRAETYNDDVKGKREWNQEPNYNHAAPVPSLPEVHHIWSRPSLSQLAAPLNKLLIK